MTHAQPKGNTTMKLAGYYRDCANQEFVTVERRDNQWVLVYNDYEDTIEEEELRKLIDKGIFWPT